jgi:hypothetical protein
VEHCSGFSTDYRNQSTLQKHCFQFTLQVNIHDNSLALVAGSASAFAVVHGTRFSTASSRLLRRQNILSLTVPQQPRINTTTTDTAHAAVVFPSRHWPHRLNEIRLTFIGDAKSEISPVRLVLIAICTRPELARFQHRIHGWPSPSKPAHELTTSPGSHSIFRGTMRKAQSKKAQPFAMVLARSSFHFPRRASRRARQYRIYGQCKVRSRRCQVK